MDSSIIQEWQVLQQTFLQLQLAGVEILISDYHRTAENGLEQSITVVPNNPSLLDLACSLPEQAGNALLKTPRGKKFAISQQTTLPFEVWWLYVNDENQPHWLSEEHGGSFVGRSLGAIACLISDINHQEQFSSPQRRDWKFKDWWQWYAKENACGYRMTANWWNSRTEEQRLMLGVIGWQKRSISAVKSALQRGKG